jgi:hypothetical protein
MKGLAMNIKTLAATSLLSLGLLACSTAATTPAAILTDAQSLAGGLAGALSAVEAADPNLIPPATAAKIATALADAKTIAGQLSTGMAPASAATVIVQVEGDINDVLNVLAAPPLNGIIPPPASQAIAAASIVLPVLEAFAAPYLPAGNAAAVAPADPAVVARAVAVLQGYAN